MNDYSIFLNFSLLKIIDIVFTIETIYKVVPYGTKLARGYLIDMKLSI